MIVMFDSVDLTQVPANPQAVLTYINGKWPTDQEARRMFPHAYILPMSVGGLVVAGGYDIEKGDYAPEQAPALVTIAHRGGVWRPVLYFSADIEPAVKQALAAAQISRMLYRTLVADWTGVPHIPEGEDGCQWTDKALGRNLDESLLLQSFFPAAAPIPDRKAAVKLTYDLDDGQWAHTSLPFE